MILRIEDCWVFVSLYPSAILRASLEFGRGTMLRGLVAGVGFEPTTFGL